MKQLTKCICAILVFITAVSAAFSAHARTTTSIFNGLTYTQSEQFAGCDILNGIDVAHHQGIIDWKKVKNAGVDFAIIRVGFRGYGETTGNKVADKYYKENIEGATAQGIAVGVYFYTQAINKQEAIDEATFTLDLIKPYKDKITLPVFWDCEFADNNNASNPQNIGRFYNRWKDGTLNRQDVTNHALAFCQTVRNAGYQAGVYSNPDFYTSKLYPDQLTAAGNMLWLAHYINPRTTYTGSYSIWQYSAKGKVDGIVDHRGNPVSVDCNFLYASGNFTVEALGSYSYTGEEIKPELQVSYRGTALIKGEDYYVTFKNNIAVGKASVVITGINDYADFPKITKKYKIVPAAVTGVALAERGDTSVRITWDAAPDTDGYQVWYKNSKGWQLAGSTAETAYTVTGLSSAANYKLKVLAYKTIGGTDYVAVDAEEFQTATKPAKVSGVALTKAGSNYLKLTWKKQSSATGYHLYQYNYETKKYSKLTSVTGGKNNSVTVKQLTPNTKYRFKVRAYKDATEGVTLSGDKSDAFVTYTAPEKTEVRSLKANKNKTVTVKWKKLAGVTGYQIMWSTTKNFSGNTKTLRIEKNTDTGVITPYQSGVPYYVRVRAYKTHSGVRFYAPWSAGKSVITK